MDGWTDGWMNGWMDGWEYGRMDGYTYTNLYTINSMASILVLTWAGRYCILINAVSTLFSLLNF